MVAAHTSWIGVDLPIEVKWTAPSEQVDDDDEIGDDDQGVADVDADLIVSTESCLQEMVRSRRMLVVRLHLL